MPLPSFHNHRSSKDNIKPYLLTSGPEVFLKSFDGYLLSDGYEAYHELNIPPQFEPLDRPGAIIPVIESQCSGHRNHRFWKPDRFALAAPWGHFPGRLRMSWDVPFLSKSTCSPFILQDAPPFDTFLCSGAGYIVYDKSSASYWNNAKQCWRQHVIRISWILDKISSNGWLAPANQGSNHPHLENLHTQPIHNLESCTRAHPLLAKLQENRKNQRKTIY